ncbi:MAG: T9SS type A sorting domain-containing protein [Bacteroidales bacterium]|nr:T9SS type A sorting domain-containing protein [Bacteroidales bacterium]
MKSQLLQLTKIGASIVFFMMLTSAMAQESFPQLIESSTSIGSVIETDLNFFAEKQAIVRYREVKLNNLISLPNAFSVDDKILLNLFENTTYTAKVRSIEENVMGTVVITADIIEANYAYAILSTHGGRSLINVFIPETGSHFQIISDPVTLKHYLIEINSSLITATVEYPSLIPGELTSEDIEEQKRIEKEMDYTKSGPGDPATIDVMIVYTPAARNWGNANGGGIFNCVATAVAIGNTAHANSATILTIRLVHTAEITYTESGDVELDLNRLTLTADGHMDIVHTWRNTYGADLVQLFSTMGGGIGWLLNSTAGKPADAFSIAGVSTSTAYTPIHEMGHNMGCGHHKDQNFQAGPGLYDYAAGWRWQGTDGVWYSSVMSYTAAGNFPLNPVNSTRVGHFSNPSVNFMGVATGHATDGDNARAIRNTKHVIAAYRSTATINCIVCPGYDFAISPGNSWSTHASSFAASGCKMYRISVEQGRTYTFKTGCGDGATANFDTYMHVYDNNCDQVAYNDEGCEDHRSIVTWMATYSGYAYVKVRGWSGAGGSYTMAYQKTDELTWQGDISTNWNTAGNWDGNVVPDNTFDVIIPTGAVRQPYVSSANASCKNLTLNSGATLTIGAYNLEIDYDADIYGTLTMNNTASRLYVYDDIRWQLGSSASATGSATIYVYGDWDFMDGANVYLTAGYVDFYGTSLAYIRSKDSDSHFYHVRNHKSGTSLSHSAASTFPCRLTGNLYIYSGCTLTSYSSQSFIIGSFVNNMSGSIALGNGTFIFDGSSGSSSFVAGDYFNNVTISSSGTTTFNQDIEIRGNLLIESGALGLGSTTLSIMGNWTNNIGTAGFVEGTSTVVFNGGNYHQYCSTETFNNLEVNKPLGGAFRVSSGTVTCNQYNWTAGAIDVDTGTFTALDLADNGLDGGYWVNPGATINLYQDALQYVDLRCHLNFNGGGTINVYGGNGYSYWPFGYNASITMSGGVLDFKDNGILINNTGALTLNDNITGGTIRMSRGFLGERADFTPVAGTFEFYGSGDYLISQANGCTLPNVKIDKSAKESGENNINGPVYDERSGHLLTDGGKANTITLGSNFVITGDLNVDAGSFNLSSYTCNVEGTTTIYGQLIMTNTANDFTTVNMYWENGSSANVTAGTFHSGNWAFREGTTAKLGTGNTTYITSNMIYPTSTDAEFGNLVRGPLSKNLSVNVTGKTYYPTKVMGYYTVKSGASLFFLQSGAGMIVAGNATIENGASISFSAADFQVGGTLNLSGTLSVSNGCSASVQGEFAFPSTGLLNLNQGTFTNNYSTSSVSLAGTLQLIEGIVEFPNRSVSISSTFNDQISGGVFRVGKTLSANSAGTFQPLAGTVEFVNTSAGNYVQVTNGNYLHNMVLDKPGSSFQVYDNLTIKGSLFIDDGVLNSNNKTISIGENWYNNVGTSAFNETNSRVIFNGTTAQFCSTEDFHILEVNKPMELLYNLAEHNINCQIYDWTSGGIWISPGNFTAYDLADNGLFGTFAIYSGTMNLHQDGAQYVDINGTVIIGSGAELNVFGGATTSYWPYYDNATVFMTGGVLDFKDVGILVYNSPTYSFTENVTAGTIRTTGHMSVNNLNFTPSGGTVELYGGSDAGIAVSAGHFHNVLINKSGGDGLKSEPVLERNGNITEGTRANTVNVTTDILVNNDLTVEIGSLNLIGVDVSAGGNVNVNSGGTIVLNNNSNLLLASAKTLSINTGGTLNAIGSLGAEARISRISTGNYGFNINSGATISAEHTIFEYMNTNGVNVNSGGIVDPARSFTNCNFRNGQSGGRLLTINNNQSLLLSNVVFPGSTGYYNVSKTVDAGVVTLSDYSGVFAGPTNEQDTYGRIHWTGQISPTVDLDGVLIGSGQDLCFEALQTITVGGSQSFVVENGGNVNLVAGQNIRLLEGTHIHNGGYLHAWITTNGIYCGSGSSMLATSEALLAVPANEIIKDKPGFGVYPNPTKGTFTLELYDIIEFTSISVEVFDLIGNNVFSVEEPIAKSYIFNLGDSQPGIYLIRVTNGSYVGIEKVIRQ